MYNYFDKLNNVKITKSHLRLHEALITLVEEKELDKITVNDLCNKAMVSRATFYNHFEDKYHLLCFTIYYMKKEIIASEQLISDFSKGEAIHVILSYINKNRNFFKGLLSSHDTRLMLGTLHDLTVPQYLLMLDACEKNGNKFIVSSDFLSEFFSGAFISIVIRWLKDDNPKTIDELTFEIDKVTDLHLYFDNPN
ncbi:TetR/AcrR family transcriptional regulator [Clostridium sp. UBA6640]|uniref:TetR/AcrR family transcriptional regulator n=1 Tax=Clostridium sp. UBA6640 TaxID=1946370 RepID=UPI0025BD40A8|nr:TetR/AcrR family transcriptional regulator [Clostridium sp. UBA6640]